MNEAAALLQVAALREILALLNGGGEEARLVGGAVRNALLDRPVHEYDIATTATPDVVIARAKAAGLRRRADRHRPRHGDRARARRTVRGHHAARRR